MRRIYKILMAAVVTVLAVTAASCSDIPDYGGNIQDSYANFDALADIVRTRYCFFEEKEVDWDAECARARAEIKDDTNPLELFYIFSDLLDKLEDGHVNLTTPFSTSYYKKWWTDYPQDFNLRTLEQYYLKFGGLQTSGMKYTVMSDGEVGYIYYPNFSVEVGDLNLDYVLALLSKTKGLIIDIRNNGGGLLSNVPTFVSRFITEKTRGGYIRHKTGPGINDFSKPFPIDYEPCNKKRISYLDRPILVLTNRSCFSAANDFVAVMKNLPNVRIVGARTGGGGGMPFSSEIPNGWAIRFSASPITDAQGNSTEAGIDPTPGYEVHCSDEELAAGKDAILDFALATLQSEISTDTDENHASE